MGELLIGWLKYKDNMRRVKYLKSLIGLGAVMSEEIESVVEDERTIEERYRDSYKMTRQQRKVVEGDEIQSVKPLDSVPEIRDGSWTNGVLAWKRGGTSTDFEVIGWWVVPRKRQKNTSRQYRVKKTQSPLDKMKSDYNKSENRISRQKRQENRAKKSIRILRSSGYSMAEALMITKGQMGLDRKPIIPTDGEEIVPSDDSEE